MGQLLAWNKRFAWLARNERRKRILRTDRWSTRLGGVCSRWNSWYYDIVKTPPIQYTPPMHYATWVSKVKYLNLLWNKRGEYFGWTKRLECLRRKWIETKRHIEKGVRVVYAEIKNERIQVKNLREMLVKQNYRCAITGRELTPDNCSVDHIVPLSRGGIHSIENAQLVVNEVNHAKSNLTEEEFLQICSDAVEYRVNK